MAMAEAAVPSCMNSQPLFAFCGGLVRALTTSISFGRFLTEPLNRERWSSFSHNRTLEDVQKYSRPGVVAERKAFFKARYWTLDQVDSVRALTTSISFGPFRTEILNWERWSSFSHNRTLEDVQKYCRPGFVAERKAFFEARYKNFALKKTKKLLDKENQAPNKLPNDDVHSPSTNLVFSQVCNVPSTSQVEQVIASDAASDPDKLSGQIKHEVTSAKSLSRNEPYKKLPSPRKAPLTPTVHPKKAAGVVTDKKRSVLQSLHMSMNFPPARNKDVASKTISKPNDRLTRQALTRVSFSGHKENPQVLPRPEHARSNTPSERSVNGSRTVAWKSHSTNHSETSSPCTKKPRSSTVPSSFSFRSDERAAKRKEFFKKIEEKGNTGDTKKIQLQPTLKVCNNEKARSDNKRLRWSTAVEVKPSTRETKAPIIQKKVTPAKQCSPKLGRKPVDDTQSPPWRSSSKTKNFIEINKKKLSSYMAKKKVHDSTLMSTR